MNNLQLKRGKEIEKEVSILKEHKTEVEKMLLHYNTDNGTHFVGAFKSYDCNGFIKFDDNLFPIKGEIILQLYLQNIEIKFKILQKEFDEL